MKSLIHPKTAPQAALLGRGILLLALMPALASIPTTLVHAQQPTRGDILTVLVGGWIGDDFLERRTPGVDPFLGPVEFGSALTQSNTIMIGLQYSLFLSNWFSTDVGVAYMSNKWRSTSGTVSGGVLGGTVDTLSVNTFPVNVNLTAHIPLLGRGPKPFVSAGAGAVVYGFSRSNAPLRITTPGGTPVDTLLFDLDLGVRFAPNAAAGLEYDLTPKIALRVEGRLWLTMVHERINNETIRQKNGWVALSSSFQF